MNAIKKTLSFPWIATGAMAGPLPPIHVPADFPSLQEAVDVAVDRQRIIVSPGTYGGGISIAGKGPFVTSIDPWDDETVAGTVIDGFDIASAVSFSSPDTTFPSAILFGFTITGGFAEDGGGIHIDHAAPSIWRCVISDNAAHSFGGRGGGVVVMGSSTAEFQRCAFSSNAALNGGFGGAIFFDEESVVRVLDCTLDKNQATYGGAVYGLGDGSAVAESTGNWFARCNITENTAGIDGGGVYLSSAAPLVADCLIDNNTARAGGGIFVLGRSAARFERSTFSENRATASFGGGAYVLFADDAEARWVECEFTENVAESRGGGIYILSSSPVFVRSSIQDNWLMADTSPEGGGIYCTGSRAFFDACTIKGNRAWGPFGGSGGALYAFDADPVLSNCVVTENVSRTTGGAFTFKSSAFGAMLWSTPTIRHCTILDNSTDNSASGAITIFGSGVPFAENCILWDNSPSAVDSLGTAPDLVYSCVEGGWQGEGNFEEDPFLLDFGPFESVLHPYSPCIDAGTGDPDGIAWSAVDSTYGSFNSATPDLGAYGGPGGLLWLAVGDSGCVSMMDPRYGDTRND
ncbi:MAG: hypothetical protein CME06_08120 [Gemmatimonadetes bacterium]|nr:hypothetical protein [Gemmatimonadota bacterium]